MQGQDEGKRQRWPGLEVREAYVEGGSREASGLGHTVDSGGSDVGLFCHTWFGCGTQTTVWASPGHKCHSEAIRPRFNFTCFILSWFVCLFYWVVVGIRHRESVCVVPSSSSRSSSSSSAAVCCHIFPEVSLQNINHAVFLLLGSLLSSKPSIFNVTMEPLCTQATDWSSCWNGPETD